MKKISNICGFIGIAIYAVLMIRISNLCQYGGTKVDLIPILILGVVLIATIIFGIVSSRKEEKIEKGKLFWGKCIVVVALTILFGGRIIYSAIPYNGALSWKIDEWRNQKKIELTHTNFFETGVEGILEDIETELDYRMNFMFKISSSFPLTKMVKFRVFILICMEDMKMETKIHSLLTMMWMQIQK